MPRSPIKTVALVLIVLLGCGPKGFKVTSSKPVTAKEARGILAESAKARQNFDNLRITADMKIDSDEQRVVFRQLVTFKRPHSMHLVSIKFGTPVLYAYIGDENCVAYSPNDNKFFAGKGFDGLIEKLTGLPLAYSDLVEIIAGGLKVPENFTVLESALLNERHYMISIKASEFETRDFLIDGQTKTFFWGRFIKTNQLARQDILINLSDFQKFTAGLYPSIIQLKQEEPYLELTLKIKKIEFASDIPPDELSIKVPRGVTPVPLEEIGRLF
jgi:hypothetical protein